MCTDFAGVELTRLTAERTLSAAEFLAQLALALRIPSRKLHVVSIPDGSELDSCAPTTAIAAQLHCFHLYLDDIHSDRRS